MPQDAFVVKIQRELCFPKSARKVSGNGPQVIKCIYSFDIIINQSRQTHSNTLLPSIPTKYCNITLTIWCLYCRGWINIIYLFIYLFIDVPGFVSVSLFLWNFSTGSPVIAILVQIKLIGLQHVYNTRYFLGFKSFRVPVYFRKQVRSRWVEACNSPTFLSRRFYTPIYFWNEFRWNETLVGMPWPITRN